jgi:NAD(P) transhydrogenase subunit beta
MDELNTLYDTALPPRLLLSHLCFLVSVVIFMLGIMRLSKVRTARTGNLMAAGAMLLAVVGQFIEVGFGIDYTWIIVGLVVGTGVGLFLAYTRKMTEMPELVALFNGFGGLASTCVAIATYAWMAGTAGDGVSTLLEATMPGGVKMSVVNAIAQMLAVLVGTFTFTGSVLAYAKLSDRWGWSIKIKGKPLTNAYVIRLGQKRVHHWVTLGLLLGSLLCAAVVIWGSLGALSTIFLILLFLLTFVLGFVFVLCIGGGDMPVVISLLNSYSGVAAAMAGFALNSPVLIISGSMVGAAGLILTVIMCKAMNRSLANVLFSGLGEETGGGGGGPAQEYVGVTSCDPETAAMTLADASSFIVVPGYGMAVAQAQHAVRELGDLLTERGCKVKYAVHPVAGRMPGHMNVLLAEANVPYDQLFEYDEIVNDFKDTDVVLVLGANDVVNPAAQSDKDCEIYGMPIFPCHEARVVYVVKRSLRPGFAGLKNLLFEYENCDMVFGDAKAVVEGLIAGVKEEG